MQPSDEDRFHLRHNGRLIEVETEPKFMEPVAQLLIDGEPVDKQSSWPKTTELQGPDLKVFVEWTLLSRPQRVWVVFDAEKITEDKDSGVDQVQPEHDLIPPAGSWAERVARFTDAHPNLYASRHVIKATLQALIGILGIGAILWGLLPRFDINIPFPDLQVGDWVRSIVPNWFVDILQLPQRAVTWLFGWVPDITFFDRVINWIRDVGFPPEWLKSVVSSARYWIPVLIAVAVALQEIDRRNKKSATASEVDSSPDDKIDESQSIENQDSRTAPDDSDTTAKPD